MNNYFEPGQEITAPIVAIANDCIFLDINSKSEGILDKQEMMNEDGSLKVKEGDTVSVFFLGAENGEFHFTTKISGQKATKSLLENAFANGIPVEGHVEKEIKGGFEVKIGEAVAFCPFSQMGSKQKEEASSYVGKNLTFKIQEYKEKGRRLVVSNRVICEEENDSKIQELQGSLKVGSLITGTVTSLKKYGAFVDISGFQALLPISEISRERIDDVSSVLKVGQEIQAKIIKADWANQRVSLSMKTLTADPWETAVANYPVDSKYTGTISKIADFGVFVALAPGLDGLVHISEIEDAKSNTNLRKLFKVGDSYSVVVKEINAKQHRLSLKPASSSEQDKLTAKYLNSQSDNGTDTYNPFAELLKNRK